MRRTFLDRLQTGLRWLLYGMTMALYAAFGVLLILVFGGFLVSAF